MFLLHLISIFNEKKKKIHLDLILNVNVPTAPEILLQYYNLHNVNVPVAWLLHLCRILIMYVISNHALIDSYKRLGSVVN